MKKRDVISSVAWIALGGAFAFGALQVGLTLKGKPGPGFLPLISGLALIVIGLFVLVPALISKEGDEKTENNPGALRRVLLCLAGLLVWGSVLDLAGYIIATAVFMTFATRLLEPPKWRTSVLVGVLSALVSYFLFSVLMQVQLPQGPLTFI